MSGKTDIDKRIAKLIGRIAKDRVEVAQGVSNLIQPLHTVDRVRDRTAEYGHWVYPLAPVVLLALARFRPGVGTLLSTATRGLSLLRLVQQLRQPRITL